METKWEQKLGREKENGEREGGGGNGEEREKERGIEAHTHIERGSVWESKRDR